MWIKKRRFLFGQKVDDFMGNGNLDLIRIYVSADSEKRVDLIIRNYPNFLGMVDGYTDVT